MTATYQVVYWAGFLGRSEAPVLMLEDAGANYTTNTDVNNFLKSNPGFPAFACPVLVKEGGAKPIVIGQTTAIAVFLGKELGYAPTAEHEVHALVMALNYSDILAEFFTAAKSNGMDAFIENRLGKWLDVVESSLEHSSSSTYHFSGSSPTYVDFLALGVFNKLEWALGEKFTSLLADKQRLSGVLRNTKDRPRVKSFYHSGSALPTLPESMKAK